MRNNKKPCYADQQEIGMINYSFTHYGLVCIKQEVISV